jgi:predicted transcriptional regulator
VTHHVTFRASPVLVARIDRLAEARKVSRSAVIKRAIVEATVPEHATAIADEQEILVLLSEAARGGSVSAMKVLLAHHRLPRPAVVDPIFQELDELAQRGGDTP